MNCEACNFDSVRHIPCTTCGAIVCPWRSCENFCGIPKQYKRDKEVITIELNSKPDSKGRVSYTLFWWMENYALGASWRAQCFFANPEERIAKYLVENQKYQVISGDSVLQSLPVVV